MPPRTLKTERVVVVRTDPDGNVLGYDVVDQPVRAGFIDRLPPIRTPRKTGSPRSPRIETYEDEEFDENEELQEEEEEEEVEEEYDDRASEPESVQEIKRPRRKARRNTTISNSSSRRRVRYVRPKSNVKIFEERVKWNADPKIDAHNEQAIERIKSAPKKKVFDEKLAWSVKPRIETHNESYDNRPSRSAVRTPKYNDPPIWYAKPKIDSHNEQTVNEILRAPRPQIFDQRVEFRGRPKIDTHNEEAVEALRRAPKPLIYDQKSSWSSAPRTDHTNEEYLRFKESERLTRQEKVYARSIPSARKITAGQGRIDHLNPEFEQHKRRKKSAALPPIENRKLNWEKRPRVSQQNDRYIERIRQKRSVPMIFQEKLRWRTKTPKIDARNEEFEEKLKQPSKVTIFNSQPHWDAEPKIDAFNDSYDPDAHPKPRIFNEKLQWRRRPKIDTGLEPESSDNEYYDDD